MTSMNISLPDDLKAFVDQYIQGRYSTASEFIRELIRRAQKEAAHEQIEQLLLEGLDSGKPIEITPEFWEERRAGLERRLKQQKPNAASDDFTRSARRHRSNRHVDRRG